MAREELKWQNIDADDLPAAVKKSFDAMVEAEATFKADLEKLLKRTKPFPVRTKQTKRQNEPLITTFLCRF